MSTHPHAAEIAALETTLAKSGPHSKRRPLSDEQVAEEMRLEAIAEERKYQRQHMTDWTARRLSA